MVKLNEYQTPIEDLNLHLYPQEVQDEFMEYLTSIPFIRNLTSPDRPHCKDLPRDESGKAIIVFAPLSTTVTPYSDAKSLAVR